MSRTICLFFGLIAMSGCAHDPPPIADDPNACVEHCFDPNATTHALDRAVAEIQKCDGASDSGKNGSVQITFEPSGHVSNVVLDAHLERSNLADCIRAAFRKSVVPEFRGEPQTVAKVFSIRGPNDGDP